MATKNIEACIEYCRPMSLYGTEMLKTQEAARAELAALVEASKPVDLDALVNAVLRCPLPLSVSPAGGVGDPHRTVSNLLTHAEAMKVLGDVMIKLKLSSGQYEQAAWNVLHDRLEKAEADVARLRDEVEMTRPVVEAAKNFHKGTNGCYGDMYDAYSRYEQALARKIGQQACKTRVETS